MKLGIDVNRHKEIIVKAISALLLLLLKHFKLNHVYQVPQSINIFYADLFIFKCVCLHIHLAELVGGYFLLLGRDIPSCSPIGCSVELKW